MKSSVLNTDFVVVGGGMAGVCAALAAARNGANVILVQDRSVLGGNASSEIRMHAVGADFHGRRPGARESGIIEEIRLEDAARNPHRSYSQWDLLLYEKILAEPAITLLLDTDCSRCTVEQSPEGLVRIVSIQAVRQSTEEIFVIRARFFADCSGDGRLGVEASADYTVGRESKAEYGEPLALEVADRQTLGSSILFTARHYPTPQPFRSPSWVRPFKKEEFKLRPIEGYDYGYWWAEWGGQLNTIQDNPAIRHELLRIALGLWDYVKNSGEHPDSANWALDWVGALPGKRESRRFLGPVVLTQMDLEAGKLFPDQVAFGGWPLDLHPPSGIDAVTEAPCRHFHLASLYSIPLRSLVSRNVANLLFAGRNISATHVAFASTRVMATCATMGQAIGTAAALALSSSTASLLAYFTAGELSRLQQRLLRDDAFLPGLRNEDRADFARSAQVTASGETRGGTAVQVIDGFTREALPALGPWADGKLHAWETPSLPGWVELSWPTPQLIREIHLTFDSNFLRELMLSASTSSNRKIIRGPQPELVREYEIVIDGKSVVSIADNVLRKRVHRLPAAVSGQRLRLMVKATHGSATARVFEIRTYA